MPTIIKVVTGSKKKEIWRSIKGGAGKEESFLERVEKPYADTTTTRVLGLFGRIFNVLRSYIRRDKLLLEGLSLAIIQ